MGKEQRQGEGEQGNSTDTRQYWLQASRTARFIANEYLSAYNRWSHGSTGLWKFLLHKEQAWREVARSIESALSPLSQDELEYIKVPATIAETGA